MASCGISCQISSNCQAKSSTFPGRCSRLPIISQTCSIGEGSGWSRKYFTSCKTVHSSTCRTWSGIIFLKNKTRILQMNGGKTALSRSLTNLCAVSVPLKTIKGAWLSKVMTAYTINLGLRPVRHAIVKAGSARCLGRLRTRL
ncbi:hypothetical protein TNCV_1600621 [Trichonephila clavipes]|nr:hypothetical protein TNCV_1600621 [Trichonephila clavipes]